MARSDQNIIAGMSKAELFKSQNAERKNENIQTNLLKSLVASNNNIDKNTDQLPDPKTNDNQKMKNILETTKKSNENIINTIKKSNTFLKNLIFKPKTNTDNTTKNSFDALKNIIIKTSQNKFLTDVTKDLSDTAETLIPGFKILSMTGKGLLSISREIKNKQVDKNNNDSEMASIIVNDKKRTKAILKNTKPKKDNIQMPDLLRTDDNSILEENKKTNKLLENINEQLLTGIGGKNKFPIKILGGIVLGALAAIGLSKGGPLFKAGVTLLKNAKHLGKAVKLFSIIGKGIAKTAKIALNVVDKSSIAGKVVSGVAKTAKSFIPKIGAKTAAKSAGKIATKTAGKALVKGGSKALIKGGSKGIGKSLLKKLPILGAIAGAGFAVQRLTQGDALGAALELTSGIIGTVPLIGTAASLAIDVGLIARDIKKATDKNKEIKDNMLDIDQTKDVNIKIDKIGKDNNKIVSLVDKQINLFTDINKIRSTDNIDSIKILESTKQTEKQQSRENIRLRYLKKAQISNGMTSGRISHATTSGITGMSMTSGPEELREYNLPDITPGNEVNTIAVKDGSVNLSGLNLGPKQTNMDSIILDSYQNVMGKGFQPTVTSGIRTKNENSKVGSSDRSKHLIGQAIDLRSNDSVMTAGQGERVASNIKNTLGNGYSVLQHGTGMNRHIHMQYNESGDMSDVPRTYEANQEPTTIKNAVFKKEINDVEKMKNLTNFLINDFSNVLAQKIASAVKKTNGNINRVSTGDPF